MNHGHTTSVIIFWKFCADLRPKSLPWITHKGTYEKSQELVIHTRKLNISDKFGLVEVTCHSKKSKLQIEPDEKTKIIESETAANKSKSKINADDALVSVTEYDNAIEIETTVDRDDVDKPKVTGVDILTNNNVEKIETGGHLEIDQVDHNGRTGIVDVNHVIDGFQYISSTMSSTMSTIFPIGNVSVVERVEEFSTFSTVRRILAGTHRMTILNTK